MMINFDNTSKVTKIKVTQTASSIGKPKYQRGTLVGLGLNKIGRISIIDYTPSSIGMINKVHHLVNYEYLEN